MENAKGQTFLKVTGILMIIGGIIGIISDIMAFVGIGILSSLASILAWLYIAAVVGLIGVVLELIAGIMGVKNADKPEKAGTCIAWGIVVIAFSIISNIISIAISPDTFNYFGLFTGLIIPVLYLIGGILNKKSVDSANGNN